MVRTHGIIRSDTDSALIRVKIPDRDSAATALRETAMNLIFARRMLLFFLLMFAFFFITVSPFLWIQRRCFSVIPI